MRGILHVLATLVVIPYAVLAGGFLALGHAIGEGSILGFFSRLLDQALWLMPWGIIGFGVGFLVLAALGLIGRLRWVAGLLLSMVALFSLLVIVGKSTSPVTVDEAVFLLPCIASFIFGGWTFAAERTTVYRAKSSV